jgi:hypothetical protein
MKGERTMHSTRRFAPLAAVAILAGCQNHAGTVAIPAPPQQVETGSKFVLRTPLAFPAGAGEILFQNEQLVPAGKLDRNMPYCKLAPLTDPPRAVSPGTFTVGAVNYDEREIGTGSGMVKVTRIELAADAKQPGYALSCGWPAGASGRTFVSSDQIFNAIGGQFSMNLLR